VLKRFAHTKQPRVLLIELPMQMLSVFWLACQMPFFKKLKMVEFYNNLRYPDSYETLAILQINVKISYLRNTN